MKATFRMMTKVFRDAAAFPTVRLQDGSRLETIRLGYSAKPKRNTSASKVAEDDRNAYPGRPRKTARWTLPAASTFSATTTQAAGSVRKLRSADGNAARVQIVVRR